jgi:NTE family protein
MNFNANETDVAVVLGPGGSVGTAWLLGLAAGLRHAGADLARADLLIGTSAGAIAAAALATGRNLDELADLTTADPGDGPRDASLMPRVLELLSTPATDPREALRQVGSLADAADALPEERHLAAMRHLTGDRDWPDARLLITAVDTHTGEPVIWTRESGVPLPAAVASSSAAPGYAAPITIRGRRYMDGGLGGGTNVHLAEGAGTLILVEPFGPMFPSRPIKVDLGIRPDEAAQRAFGADLLDGSRWSDAYKAGLRQSAQVVDELEPLLP